MKRLTLLLVLPQLFIILDSCCDRHSTYQLVWTGLTIHNTEITQNDNDSLGIQYSEDSVFNSGTYGFWVGFMDETIANKKTNSNISFIQKAMATTCLEDVYLLSDSIEKIWINTIRDFDENHTAGEDISELFNFILWNGQQVEINKILDKEYGVNSDKEGIDGVKIFFDFVLLKAPQIDSLVQFEFSVLFESGKILSDTTQIVKIIDKQLPTKAIHHNDYQQD